jgi:hypothetical protein
MPTISFIAVWPLVSRYDQSRQIVVDDGATPNEIMNALCQLDYGVHVGHLFADVTWTEFDTEFELGDVFPKWDHPRYLRYFSLSGYTEQPKGFLSQT